MEQLIVMKRRIEAVETIKKVTHAMRLIAMSSHSRFNDKRVALTKYKQAFQELWGSVQSILPPPEERVLTHDQLIILIGSEKGLCGTFNTSLFKYFHKQDPSLSDGSHIIGIGARAVKYLQQKKIPQVASYEPLKADQFVTIAQAVTDHILYSPFVYRSVTVYSNKQKTFFVQRPQKAVVYPLPDPEITHKEPLEYLFEQSPDLLRARLSSLYLSITLQELLFESLLSEHAARFISMDASTRNADNLLSTLKTNYNKIRQATITRELTELSATL